MRSLSLPQSFRITLAAALGSGLEYYCFVTYALLANHLSDALFKHADPRLVTAETLLVYATGYAITPLSAWAFGRYADRYGRKQPFLFALLLMTCATFLMGCLPTYAQAGDVTVGLLIFLRLLQGISAGAEIPGAITFISEHATDANRGLRCGLLFLGIATGSILAGTVNSALSHWLPHEWMATWGWRLSFWIGGLLGVVSLWLRRHAMETPLFLAVKDIVSPQMSLHIWVQQVLRLSFLRDIAQGASFVWFGASLVTFGVFLPTVLSTHLSYSFKSVLTANTLALALTAIGLPLFGALSDRVNRGYWLCGAATFTILSLPAILHLFSLNSASGLLMGCLLYQFGIITMASVYPCMLAELFTTKERYTGIGIAYAGTYALVGFVPVLTNQIMTSTHSLWGMLWYFIPAGLLTAVGSLNIALKTDRQYQDQGRFGETF